MRKMLIGAALAGLCAASAAQAQVEHAGPAMSPIASSVYVPAGSDTIYVSGMTPTPLNADAPKGTPPVWGTTEEQTTSVLTKLKAELATKGFTFGDVAMMRVYLVGDPATGKMDFPGMMNAYKKEFGTPEQPNKPARVTMQVASLVGPGMLVEIEVQAARVKK